MRSPSRSKQRGFLYLTTGANGAGKTLNALKWVRDRQLKENRAVYYNGRFEMVADFGWIVFEFKDWQTLPDGALIVVDECHNDIPARAGSAPPSEHIRMLAEHRRRGFDFYLITQHPQNIDLFVRRLIGSPGWHRHLKRTFGTDLVSVLEWSAVNGSCEKTGASKDAKVSMVGFPKEVYDWYKSASLHTGKKSIPKQVYMLGLFAILIPLMVYFAYTSLMKPAKHPLPVNGVTATVPGVPGATSTGSQSDKKKPLTAAEYAESFVPRFAGFPQSAPRYDEINAVVQAPKPAACIDGTRPGAKVRSCECWTQQATPVAVPAALCKQIASGGFFDDTIAVASANHSARSASASAVPVASALDSPSQAVVVADISTGFGLRNSGFLATRAQSVQSVVSPPSK